MIRKKESKEGYRCAEKMKIQKIKERGILFIFDSFGWNLNVHLILGKRYNYLIDTGLGPLCIEPVKEYIVGGDRPLMVINTHYHWDHIWGNASLKDSVIISHKLCRDKIKAEWDAMLEKNRQYCCGNVEMRLPDIVFDSELYFPEDKVRILYTPGHTIDSISVMDEEDRVINLGDNIGDTVEEIVPNIYSEKDIYVDTLLKYSKMDFDFCVSGHNDVLGKNVIKDILKAI